LDRDKVGFGAKPAVLVVDLQKAFTLRGTARP